jgi:uncharacterized caspase-like protein
MIKRAVVVGINDYTVLDPTGQSNLNYCVRDAQAMYWMLIDAFGFDPSNVYYYADAAASRTNILRALRYITTTAEAGDVGCFYYSGHGARVQDPNSPGTFYEAICPYSGNFISDFEMYQIADNLEPSVLNFTIILDSCHSGGMGDAAPQGAKAKSLPYAPGLVNAMMQLMNTLVPCGICLPHDQIATLLNNVRNVSANGSGSIDLDEDPDKTLIRFAKSTLIAGCQFNEFSWENATLGHGLLTQSFLDLVNQSNFQITYDSLLDELRSRVSAYASQMGVAQHPQLRGQQNRMEEGFLDQWIDCR